MAPISCSVCSIQNLLVLLNSSWTILISAYNDILDTIQITDKKLLHFKLSKSGHILHVLQTSTVAGFPRPGHINS